MPSSISLLTIYVRTSNSPQLIDPTTLQTCEITSPSYWYTPLDSLAIVIAFVVFIVLDDMELLESTCGNYVAADV